MNMNTKHLSSQPPDMTATPTAAAFDIDGDHPLNEERMIQPIKLFLIEDYRLVRLGLISSLETFENLHFIGEAASGEEALFRLEKEQPDIILIDLGLPGMDGIELTQEVMNRWPHVKTIILTSHEQPEEVIAALGAGAQAYVLKDIRPERLAQVIETVFDGACWLDPAIANVALNVFNNEISISDACKKPGISAHIPLSEREQTILELLVQGKNNPAIANELCVSVHTVKVHVSNIFQKLAVSDRVQAAVKALRENMVP